MFMEDKTDQWPQETLSIFETIVKKQVFSNVSAILSLNKTNTCLRRKYKWWASRIISYNLKEIHAA